MFRPYPGRPDRIVLPELDEFFKALAVNLLTKRTDLLLQGLGLGHVDFLADQDRLISKCFW
jgi:hypothetical protein